MKHLLLTTIAAVVLVGCGPSKPPDISIHNAAHSGDIEAIKQAIADGVNVNSKGIIGGSTPLLIAAMEGHNEVVELLISKGADVDARWHGDGATPLRFAAARGYKEIVELLISKGADVNAKAVTGETPLDYAKGETADLLRKYGGKTGAELSIHQAALTGNIEAVKQHLAAGADVNAKHNIGHTPLDWAISNDQTKTADLLRKHGGKTAEELKAGN